MKNKLKLSWRPKEGEEIKCKIYDDEKIAIKAKNWLIQNGAVDIDLAICVQPKPAQPQDL